MSRDHLIGGVVMVVCLVLLFLYIFWSGSPYSGRAFGYIFGFLLGHVLVYATTQPRRLRKWLSGVWILASLVGLFVFIFVSPNRLYADSMHKELQTWVFYAEGFLMALAISAMTRLGMLWGLGRWREF